MFKYRVQHPHRCRSCRIVVVCGIDGCENRITARERSFECGVCNTHTHRCRTCGEDADCMARKDECAENPNVEMFECNPCTDITDAEAAAAE